VIFVTNLPLLFASTALAPLSFMPTWLQVVASLNPLSYAIEPIRHIYTHSHWLLSDVVMQTPFAEITMTTALLVLLGFSTVIFLSIRPLLRRSFA
jgi:ABC-2 type transport system permease protein